MNAIAEALRNLIDRDVAGISRSKIYFGPATRSESGLYITYFPTDDMPIRIHTGGASDVDQGLKETHWDFKIWGPNAMDVGDIYEKLTDAFNKGVLDVPGGIVGLLCGNGMPMMAEENEPNNIIYSRVLECIVFFMEE